MTYRTFIIFVLAWLVTGCVTYQTPLTDDFRGIEPAPRGQARVYFLRPVFSKVLRDDSPALSIDSVTSIDFVHGTYFSVVLDPGPHQLSLKPHLTDSSLWDTSMQFTVEADHAYFIAIWYDVEHSSGLSFVPVMGKVPFLIPMKTSQARATRARVEVVSEEDAQIVLKQLHYVSIKNSESDTKP